MRTSAALIIAACAFGAGVVADRFVFPPSKDAGGGAAVEGDLAELVAKRRAEGAAQPTAQPGTADAADPEPSGDDADDERRGPVEQVFEQLERGGEIDFANAIAVADRLPAGDRRGELIRRIASRWARSDPRAALQWIDGLVGGERTAALEHLVSHWAEVDPAAAAAYVAQLPSSQRSLDYVHRVSRIWAELDQPGAIAAAMAQGDPAVRRRALRGAAEVWAYTDPEAASAFATQLESPSERRAVLEEVAHRWAAQSADDALEWAGALSGEDRRAAMSAILDRLAAEDPRHAAAVYDEWAPSLADPSEQDRTQRQIAREVASRWAASAPGEAAQWALTLPEAGEIQRAAVHEVSEHWLRLDSLAASDWIGQLPAGATRDAAAGAVVEHIAASDPESAFAWATSIADEGSQTDRMHHALERWNAVDPAAARAALNGADISSHQREHFDDLFGPTTTAATGDAAAGDGAEPD